MRVRAAGAVFLALALIAVGCGGGNDEEGQEAEPGIPQANELPADTAEPQIGGTLQYGLEADVSTFVPQDNVCPIACGMVLRAVYDPLAEINEDGEVVGVLLSDIAHNEDYTEWTLTVRDGITFHDGTPLNGDAVVTSFERGRGSPVLLQALADVESVTAEGQVVTVRTRRPWVALDYGLTTQVGFIASPTWLAAVDAGTAQQTEPVGTGPFRFESYEAGGSVSVVRNEDYWRTDEAGNPLPYLDGIDFTIIEDSQSRVNALRSGELDLTHVFQGDLVADLRDNPGDLELLENSDEAETVYVLLNNAEEVMGDVDVRRALAQATNAELINEAVGGGISQIANGPFPPGSVGYVEDNGSPGYDLAAAQQAIEDYEADNGPLEVSLKTTSDAFNLTATELIADQWEQAGVDVSIDQVEQVQFVLDAARGEFQALTFRALAHADPDQLNYFLSSQTAAPIGSLGINFHRIEDDEVDAALDIIREDPDPAAREEAAITLNRRLADQVMLLPLFWVIWSLPHDPAVHQIATGYTTPDGDPISGVRTGLHQLSQIWLEQ